MEPSHVSTYQPWKGSVKGIEIFLISGGDVAGRRVTTLALIKSALS